MRASLVPILLFLSVAVPGQSRGSGGSNSTLVQARPLTEQEDARRRTAVVQAVEKAAAAVINVYVKVGENPRIKLPFAQGAEFVLEGQGSGVIIDPSGLAITNWHVVDSATEDSGEQKLDHKVEITLNDETSYQAAVLSTDRERDLALLQIQVSDDVRLHAIELGDSDGLLLGETVIAIGNPFGQASSVSMGILSAVNRDVRIGGPGGSARTQKNLLQIDADINPGNSGGALIDINGRLIGINNAGSILISGINFAIPVNTVRSVFMNDLVSVDRLRSVYLGLSVEDRSGAVVVVGVEPDSPASRAGVEVGDRLRLAGDIEVSTSVDFNRAMLGATADGDLTLEVERDGESLRLSPRPLSNAAYGVLRRTGLELMRIPFGDDPDLVRSASIALQREISGNPAAVPGEMMSAVLRVVGTRPETMKDPVDIRVGDLLVGIELATESTGFEVVEIVKCEDLDSVNSSLESLAEDGAAEHDVWLMRDGQLIRRTLRILGLR